MIKLNVGISDLKVVNTPTILETQSLGSCLGIVMYDPLSKVSGLAHTMLPDSKKSNVGNKPAKYIDTAIAELLNQMLALGADRGLILAKISGGACMFSSSSLGDFMNIGARNTAAAKAALHELKIQIVAEDCGGSHGRTLEFDTTTGKVLVKSAMHPLVEL
jgi:chemotaxis protein CheD